jgi:hypothetical protein
MCRCNPVVVKKSDIISTKSQHGNKGVFLKCKDENVYRLGKRNNGYDRDDQKDPKFCKK